ncbi:MAG: carboxylesterase family protein [Sandaracinus sp.]
MKVVGGVAALLVALVGIALLVRFVVSRPDAPDTEVAATDDEVLEEEDAGPGSTLEVETPAGRLRGVARRGAATFRNIPYALPPLGDARFRPPVRAPRTEHTIDATHAGPLCPQLSIRRDEGEGGAPRAVIGDEDCLHLDVWTHLDGTARPVMVYFHGGSFQHGGLGARLPLHASAVVQQGEIVLVEVSYRLGALGFLAHPALAAENGGATGNDGIRDQIVALEWIRDNIAALGGDPTRVTIVGDGSGGESVCALIASPLADGLYARAIAASPGGCSAWRTLNEGIDGRLSGYARGGQIVEAAGCGNAPDVASCLRVADLERLVRAGARGERHLTVPTFGPVIDGVVIPETAAARLRRGDVHVPLLVGTDAQVAPALPHVADANYDRAIGVIAAPRGAEALAIWPRSIAADAPSAFQRAAGEMYYVCPAEELARAATEGGSTAYVYLFRRHPQSPLGDRVGAFRGIELAYLFAPDGEVASRFPDDLAVSQTMRASWTSFVTSGAPTTSPAWPAYALGAPAIFVIDAPSVVAADVSEGRCRRAREAGLSFPF